VIYAPDLFNTVRGAIKFKSKKDLILENI